MHGHYYYLILDLVFEWIYYIRIVRLYTQRAHDKAEFPSSLAGSLTHPRHFSSGAAILGGPVVVRNAGARIWIRVGARRLVVVSVSVRSCHA